MTHSVDSDHWCRDTDDREHLDLDDVVDPWAPQPRLTGGQRLRRMFRSRYLGHVRLTGNRRLSARVDLKGWMVGVDWYGRGEATLRVGPLVISVEEPPF